MNTSSEWQLLAVAVSDTEIDIVSDYLWSRGVVAIEEIRTGDVTELRTSYGNEVEQLSRDLQQRFPHLAVRHIKTDRAVADTWREFAQPVHIDDTLQIVPLWQATDARASMSDSNSTVFIDPEDVFGLGNHPTTVAALRLARRHVRSGSTVFDFGCGSGVLAIAMAKTHGCDVVAHDIAENAEEIVASNARANNVDVRWATTPLDTTPLNTGTTYDTVLANILAPVLRDISSVIREITHHGSLIVLAGMRAEQWPSVQEHYEWCAEIDSVTIDGWHSVVLSVRD